MDNDQTGIRPIDELNQLSATVDSVQELADLKPIFARVEEIAKQNAGATDIELAVKRVKTQLVNRGKKLKEAGAIGTVSSLAKGDSAFSFSPTPSPMAGRHETETGPMIPIPTLPSGENPARRSGQSQAYQNPPPPPLPTFPASTTTPSGQRPSAGVFAVPQPLGQQPAPAPASRLSWKSAMVIGAIAGLIGAVVILRAIIKVANRNNPPIVHDAGNVIKIITVPAGAKIQINGQDKCTSPCDLQLAPGNYEIAAQLEGYDSASSAATLVAGVPAAPVNMTLTSQAQSLRILSDIVGKVQMDGKPQGDILEGSYIMDRVPPGPHTVTVSGSGADASFSFEVTPGKVPEMKGPATAHNLMARTSHRLPSAGPISLTCRTATTNWLSAKAKIKRKCRSHFSRLRR